MPAYRFTPYFENEVLRKRPYLRKEWCIRAIEQPLRVERQEHNRWRFLDRDPGTRRTLPPRDYSRRPGYYS